jgi:hypothetical protein
MTPAAVALVAEFEAAAKTAQIAETELRKTMAEQIGRLERQRAFAFRRTRLIRTLAAAAGTADVEETDEAEARPIIWKRQQLAVRDELGWTDESKSYDAIIVQLQPVGLAVWQCACSAEAAASSHVQAELEKFETWFEAEHGKSFYALFDQYSPQVPVVDF